VFTGDAAKNRAEAALAQRRPQPTTPGLSTATIENLAACGKKRPGSVLVPGHDLPMTQKDGHRSPTSAKRRAALKVWFGRETSR